MRIYEDKNELRVNALSGVENGKNLEGHEYQALVGPNIVSISFQNGTIPEFGVNGLTNEALLAVLLHRTRHLNKLFPCRENSLAITKMEEALMWFEERTRDRIARGAEGKNEN